MDNKTTINYVNKKEYKRLKYKNKPRKPQKIKVKQQNKEVAKQMELLFPSGRMYKIIYKIKRFFQPITFRIDMYNWHLHMRYNLYD